MADYTGIQKIKIGDNTFELAVDWSNVTNQPTIPVDTDRKVRTSAITSASSIYLAGPTTNSSTTGELNIHNGLYAQFSAASTSGYINLIIGSGNAGQGRIRLYGALSGSNQYYTLLTPGTPTANRTITLPNKTGTIALTSDISDTKNTAGSTDSSSKLFLIGATSQAANPQTYSHDTAYVGTDGCLYSGGSKVLTAHNTYSITNSGSGNAVTAVSLSGTTFTVTKDTAFLTEAAALDKYHPVGSYFETSDSTFDPNVEWGGTWEAETEGQVHVSAGYYYPVSGALTNESDGGKATVTLTTNQIPSHTHSSASLVNIGGTTSATPCAKGTNYGFGYGNPNFIGSTGGGEAHNNMQPHINVYRWHRVA